jgi:hypothetical protein
LLADSLDWGRLTGLSIASVVGVCATLIVAHGLWERARPGRVREQVVLFNMATLVTVLIGVLALHAALLALTAAGAAVLLTPGLLEETLGHAVGPLDYARLSWLIASLATVGGALGAGIEQTDRVREAAYAFRPDERVDRREARLDEHITRMDEHMARGNENLARNNEVVAEVAERMERMDARAERMDLRVSDVGVELRQSSLRNERVLGEISEAMGVLTAEARAGRDAMVGLAAEVRAGREGLLIALDRFFGGPGAASGA